MLLQQRPIANNLIRQLVMAACLLILPGVSGAVITDPVYHDLQETYDRIFFLEDSLRSAGRNWMKIDSIGYSQSEGLPIYCVRINENVDDTLYRKPAVVFIGQVHAEEVLGVELCLWMIPRILANTNWRRTVDTYIVPTANPEGLQVVYSIDNTYRKNKRDNIGDGRFRWQIGWGFDTSGVDINRNFPFFWTNGSPFLKRGDNELYDYYRGPGPFSEPEAQAIDRLINRVRPLYSVVLHSSRTGKVAEQVIYPWHYGNKTKKCPDQDSYDALATEVATRCKKYGQQDQVYERVRILNAQGDCEAYLYWKYGAFAMRVEIGAEGEAMQPDSAGVTQVLNDVVAGMEYLLNAASARIETSRLDIRVADQATGSPLEAKLVIPKLRSEMIPFRTTNPLSGYYRWIVFNGFNDTLTVSRFGYQTRKLSVVGGTAPSPVGGPGGIRLVPLPRRNVSLILEQNGMSISRDIELDVNHPDSSWGVTIANGNGSVVLPDGRYNLTFSGGWDYVPRRVSIDIESDTTLHIALAPAAILLDQGFDFNDITYTSDNLMNDVSDHTGSDSTARWELTDEVYHSAPRAITDSRRGSTFRNDDAWMAPYNLFDSRFDLSHAGTAYLSYWINQALEPGFDSLWVEAASGGSSDPATWSWTQIAPAHQELSSLENVPMRPWNGNAISYQRYGKWKRFIVPLDNCCGGSNTNVHIRWRLRTDPTLQEDGVVIDDIVLFSSDVTPPAVSSVNTIPTRFTLDSPFPNPFNSRFQARIALPEAGRATLALYDLSGRIVMKIVDRDLQAGVQTFSIDGQSLAAGMYLLRATGPKMTKPEIRKLTLIK